MSLEAYYSRPLHERIAIVAVNLVHPAGSNLAEYWRNVLAGRICIGVKNITLANRSSLQYIGEIQNFDPSPYIGGKQLKKADRFAQYAIGAGIPMLLETGILSYATHPDRRTEAVYTLQKVDPDRVGVELGIAAGGTEAVERAAELIIRRGESTPRTIPYLNPAKQSTELGGLANFTGRQVTHNSACTSGLLAFEEAMDRILRNKADLVVAGSAEAIGHAVAFDGFRLMRVLAKCDPDNLYNETGTLINPSRPLRRDRIGLVIGEGAALGIVARLDFAIELAKIGSFPIIAELASVVTFTDAKDELIPSPENVAKLLARTLEEAELAPEDIDGLDTHTAGTLGGDPEEIAGAKLVFQDHARNVTIRPSKLNGGHLMGPIGAVGIIDAVQAINTKKIPPIPFAEEDLIDSQGFDFPTEIREKDSKAWVVITLGLDGQYGGAAVVELDSQIKAELVDIA